MVATSKRTFVLLMKNVGDLLDLDTRLSYDQATDEEGTYIQYHQKEADPIKVLKMNKLPEQRAYRFTYSEVLPSATTSEAVQNTLSIDLSFGEVRNLQTLVEYSIPLLLGWHCIYNPSVVSSTN